MAEDRVAEDRAARRTTAALFAGGMVAFGQMYATQPLLPDLARRYGVGPAAVSLTVSATTLLLAVSLLAAGRVTGRVGRRPVMVFALVGSSLLTLAGAVVVGFPQLVALRALTGVVVAGMPAVALAHLAAEVPARLRPRATAVYVAGTALGGMAGRVAAAGLTDIGGASAALAGVGVGGLVLSAIFWVLLPRAAAIPDGAFASPPPALPGWRRILTDPVVVRLSLAALLLMSVFVALYNYLTFRLTSAPYDLSPGAAGLVFFAYAAGSASSAAAGRASDGWGRLPVALGGVVLVVAGLLLTLATPLALVVAGVVVVTVGFFATHALASGWAASHVPGGQDRSAAVYLTGYYLGSALGGTGLGFVVQAYDWPGLVSASVLVVLAAAVLLGWPERRPDTGLSLRA